MSVALWGTIAGILGVIVGPLMYVIAGRNAPDQDTWCLYALLLYCSGPDEVAEGRGYSVGSLNKLSVEALTRSGDEDYSSWKTRRKFGSVVLHELRRNKGIIDKLKNVEPRSASAGARTGRRDGALLVLTDRGRSLLEDLLDQCRNDPDARLDPYVPKSRSKSNVSSEWLVLRPDKQSRDRLFAIYADLKREQNPTRAASVGTRGARGGSANADEARHSDTRFVIDSEHLVARGEFAASAQVPDGFKVLAGSAASADEASSLSQGCQRTRKSLLSDGILAASSGRYEFNYDHVFATPTQAASVVLGRSNKGIDAWLTEDDRSVTLGDLAETREASGTPKPQRGRPRPRS